jgi:hypothetical protein
LPIIFVEKNNAMIEPTDVSIIFINSIIISVLLDGKYINSMHKKTVF